MAEARIVFETNNAEDINTLISDLDMGILWLEHKINKLNQVRNASLPAHRYKTLEQRINHLKKSLFLLVAVPRY